MMAIDINLIRFGLTDNWVTDMLLIELNEFNKELLSSATRQLKLPHFQKMLSMQHSTSQALESEERFGLDPWVQWVSIHTGMPAKKHGIWHLGESDKLIQLQLWDQLANRYGIRYGIWGAMNARNTYHDHCDFFFPDPWSFSESAFPNTLKFLLALPRYYAKHYLNLKLSEFCRNALPTLAYLAYKSPRLYRYIPSVAKLLTKSGLNNITLFACFDLLNAVLYRQYRQRNQTELCVVFLNSLAHFQHHSWPTDNLLSESYQCVFALLDIAVGELLESCNENEPVVVANAFSQTNTLEREEYLYRQKDPECFFKAINLPSFTVEQLMTNDSQLLFESRQARDRAADILNGIFLEGTAAFQVQKRKDDPHRLFCQFLIWKPIDTGSLLTVDDQGCLRFYDYFEPVTRRTGSHTPEGDLYFRNIDLPPEMMNYDLMQYIDSYYSNHFV